MAKSKTAGRGKPRGYEYDHQYGIHPQLKRPSKAGRRSPGTAGPAAAPNEPSPPKLSIYSVEGPRIMVTAMHNPKELQIDKSVPWTKQAQSKGDQPSLQFTSAEGRSMSFELMFDTYETGTNVHTAFIDHLVRLALVQNPNGAEDKKRPPKVGVKWGAGLPEFQGVVESVSTKYTMFLPDGTPVRATCHVTVREASHLAVKK